MNDNLPRCFVCKDRKTKYKCISCCLTICNICAVSAKSSDDGYSEEEKKVGFCGSCLSQKNKSKEIADCTMTVQLQPRKVYFLHSDNVQ